MRNGSKRKKGVLESRTEQVSDKEPDCKGDEKSHQSEYISEETTKKFKKSLEKCDNMDKTISKSTTPVYSTNCISLPILRLIAHYFTMNQMMASRDKMIENATDIFNCDMSPMLESSELSLEMETISIDDHSVDFIQKIQKLGHLLGIYSKLDTQIDIKFIATKSTGNLNEGESCNETESKSSTIAPEINLSTSELKSKLKKSIQLTRKKIDESNRDEFLSHEVSENKETQAARTRMPNPQLMRTPRIQVNEVENEWGPLDSRTNEQQKQSLEDNSLINQAGNGGGKFFGIETRVKSLEEHLVGKDKSTSEKPGNQLMSSLLERVSKLEQWVMDIEERDPETALKAFHAHLSHSNKPASNWNRDPLFGGAATTETQNSATKLCEEDRIKVENRMRELRDQIIMMKKKKERSLNKK